MKKIGVVVISCLLGASSLHALELPDAEPGQCYAKVLVPAKFETRSERVLVQPKASSLAVRPATYKKTFEEIVVREESVEYKVIPAKYEYRNRRILVTPEKKVTTVVAPEFKEVDEQVLVRPAHFIWKPGRGPFEQVDRATGEILCRVKVPAVYGTVKKRVVQTPAKIVQKVIPATYKTIRTRVLVSEARVEKKVIPAVTRKVEVERLDTPLRTETTQIDAVYKNVETRIRVAGERFEYRPILCETNTTPTVVRRIQSALRDAGFYKGIVDGSIGRGTLDAISRFQQARGLETGNLTLRTIQALGVDLEG